MLNKNSMINAVSTAAKIYNRLSYFYFRKLQLHFIPTQVEYRHETHSAHGDH